MRLSSSRWESSTGAQSNEEATSVSLIVRTGKQQTGPASQRRTRSEDEKHSFCDDDEETLFQRRGTSKRNKQTEGGDFDREEVGRDDIFAPSPLHRAWQPNPPTNAAPTVLIQGQPPTSSDMCLLPVPRTRHSPKNPWTRRVDDGPQQFVPVPRPSSQPVCVPSSRGEQKDVTSRPVRTQHHQNVSSRRVSWLPANATSRRSPPFSVNGRRQTNRVGHGWKRNRPGV